MPEYFQRSVYHKKSCTYVKGKCNCGYNDGRMVVTVHETGVRYLIERMQHTPNWIILSKDAPSDPTDAYEVFQQQKQNENSTLIDSIMSEVETELLDVDSDNALRVVEALVTVLVKKGVLHNG